YITAIAANSLDTLASANLAAGGGLTTAGDFTIGSLTGAGQLNLSNAGRLSVAGNNLDSLFAGSLAGNGGLDKFGAGVLELSGTSTNSASTT
ncbi:hypothetical protein CSV86_000005, partial [Pseudomonas putida CSV86]